MSSFPVQIEFSTSFHDGLTILATFRKKNIETEMIVRMKIEVGMRLRLIWFELSWVHLIWSGLIRSDPISSDLIWIELSSFDLIWFDLSWFNVTWFD
jgi:hypothetical protein